MRRRQDLRRGAGLNLKPLLRAGGPVALALGLYLIGEQWFAWRSDYAPALLRCLLGGTLVAVGLSLWDASRLVGRRRGVPGEAYGSWVMLCLALGLAAVLTAALYHRPELAIAFVFAGAFFIIALVLRWMAATRMRRAARKIRSAKAVREAFEVSLTGDTGWTDGLMREEDAYRPVPLWPVFLFGGLGLAAFLGGLFRDWFLVVIGALAMGLGGLVLFHRLRGRARLVRYGVCTFKLAATPLSLKDGIGGVLHIPSPPKVERLQAKLRCIRYHYETQRSHDGRTRRVRTSTTLFEEVQAAPLSAHGTADVSFAPSASFPSANNGREAVHWRLEFYAPDEQLSFGAEFRLPVTN